MKKAVVLILTSVVMFFLYHYILDFQVKLAVVVSLITALTVLVPVTWEKRLITKIVQMVFSSKPERN